MKNKALRRIKRHKKIRYKIRGSSSCPRLSVFKSNKYIYAQLIDDQAGRTIVSASEKEIKKRSKKTINAFEVGKILAQKALEKKIRKVVFDRGGYRYHGRVKSLAEGVREGGLIF